MPLLVWSDTAFAVGVDVIDEQHKKLVDMVNTLHHARLHGNAPDILGKLFEELIAYTQYHFGTEEELMRRSSDPSYPAHKLEHDELAAQAVALQQDFRAGKRTVTLEVATFLRDWLVKHIQGTDRKLGHYLQGKGVGDLAGSVRA